MLFKEDETIRARVTTAILNVVVLRFADFLNLTAKDFHKPDTVG